MSECAGLDRITEHLGDEPSESVLEELREHIATCPECRTALASVCMALDRHDRDGARRDEEGARFGRICATPSARYAEPCCFWLRLCVTWASACCRQWR